ncbi:MAG: hypothetical protein QM820_09540 [Minicystis sp.]
MALPERTSETPPAAGEPPTGSKPAGKAPAAKKPYPDRPKTFEAPVTWLFGSKLLRQVGWIALYSLWGRRLGGIDWMNPGEPIEEPLARPNDEEFWFDYIADSGDSQKATYSIAYLCLSDLFLEDVVAKDGRTSTRLVFEPPAGAPRRELPRGRFLFVGGDTAYHVANHRTLTERFRNPFCWAYHDLKTLGKPSVTERSAHLYAIPGNHDYYDALRGFNYQFRQPVQPGNPLAIPTFTCLQNASYVAIKLPFDWWFFGLDTQEGKIDFRQRVYFKRLIKEGDPDAPRKIIVATPEPTTVFGKQSTRADEISDTQIELGLGTPFTETNPAMKKGCCRLDLSGDIHHYARYWGPPDNASYASVVSGLGGAFLHPSHTMHGTFAPDVLYPAPDDSRRAVNRWLVSWQRVFRGGNVPTVAFLLGVVLFAAYREKAAGALLERFVRACGRLSHVHLSLAAWTSSAAWQHFWRASAGLLLSLLGPAAAVAALLLLRGYAKGIEEIEIDPDRASVDDTATEKDRWWLRFSAYALLLVVAFAPLLSSRLHLDRPSGLAQSSLLFVFWVLGLGGMAVAVWHREVLDERAKKRLETKWWDDLLSVAIAASGFAALAGAMWAYGDLPAKTVGLHVAFLALSAVATFGLWATALILGAKGHRLGRRIVFLGLGLWHSALQFGVPLLWARQGFSPWMIAYLGIGLAAYGAGRLIAGYDGKKAGAQAAERAKVDAGDKVVWRLPALLILWVVMGGVGLYIPASLGDVKHFSDPWSDLFNALAVGAVAALTSPLWFGWYLAVALALDGHNNEAGGAARVEGYKQIIRIRITKEKLTAFVIGIDEVQDHGKNLEPRLVDVFDISPASAVETEARAPHE